MSKTEELNNLFEKWKREKGYKNEDFVKDGIVDEELWNKAKIKILVILKEPNVRGAKRENKKEIEDIRKHICEEYNQPGNMAWERIGHWIYGLQNTNIGSIPSYSKAKSETEKYNYCRMSAVMNLKKSGGGGSADLQKIEKFGEQDRKFIEEEINIISPEIIICGGTFEKCKKIFEKEITPIGERLWKSAIGREEVWIDYVHPSQRNRADILYYSLMMYYQRYLKIKDI